MPARPNATNPPASSRGTYQQLRAQAGTPEPPLLASAAPVGYSQRLSDSSFASDMHPPPQSYGRLQSMSSQGSQEGLPHSSSSARLLPQGAASSSSSHSSNGRKYGPSAGAGAALAASAVSVSDSPLPSRVADAYSSLSKERMAQLEKIDDELHDTSPRSLEASFHLWSWRGWANALTLVVMLLALLGLFALYPLLSWYYDGHRLAGAGGFNLGGINATGQVPSISNFPALIDPDTPQSAFTHQGHDGNTWNLVFSDEFNKDGRTFFDGDDPYFTAVDLHYWPTGDKEWYDPSAITTKDGHLVITMTQEPIHYLNLKSGMLQSWNKLCFAKNGYMEVSLSMPGKHTIGGFWPGVWTMGNLGRPGYGATTEGLWPYSYDSCDIGTLPNQTYPNATGPYAALHEGKGDWVDGVQAPAQLSKLPGQRLSACTCAGEDHPGPSTNVGRSAPEIDLIEAQIVYNGLNGEATGQVSQSFQLAPFDPFYYVDTHTPGTYTFTNETLTGFNGYTGGQYQEAASGVTYLTNNNQYYDEAGENAEFQMYGMEWSSNAENRQEAYVAWWSEGQPSWVLHGSALAANESSEIGQRIVTEEPMSLIFNLGASDNFETVQWQEMTFPNYFRIDYVRVYQLESGTVGCDPADHPTADYIQRHAEAYNNPNLTIWTESTSGPGGQAGYGQVWPKNSLVDTC